MSNLAIWLIALITGVVLTTALLRRLFGVSDGSVAKDYRTQIQAARDLDKEIQQLRKESTRDTADFQEALRKHRARFGSPYPTNDDEPPHKPAS